MRNAVLCALYVLCTLTAPHAAEPRRQAPAAPELESSLPIERPLARGEEHRYRLSLAAGEYAAVVVEQKGIDVTVAVRDGDEGLVAVFEDAITRTGTERVEVVAGTAATYTLVVKAADPAFGSGRYAIRLDFCRTATAADRVMQASRTLLTTGRQLEPVGKYDEARPLLEKALALAESVRGPNDPEVAAIAFELGGNAFERLDDAKARACYERAMAVFEKAWGAAHPYTAMARSRLGMLYERAGEAQKAEAFIRDARPLLERSLGAEHPWHLLTLATLATLRDSAGDHEEAEAIIRRALAAIKATHQDGTVLEAILLNDLGQIRHSLSDDAAAEPPVRRAIDIGEATLGGDSLLVANGLQVLGISAWARRDFPAALAYDMRAVAIREQRLGRDHPSLAGLFNNIAIIYRVTGEDAKALETHMRALSLFEKTVGPFGRDTLVSVGNIGRVYAARGDVASALVWQHRADAILETQLSLTLAVGSERQKLAFARSVAGRTDRTLSLHLRQAPDDPDAASLAALVLLQRKGRVQDAMTNVFAAVRQRVADSRDRALLDRLKETTSQLARESLYRTPAAPHEDDFESIGEIEARKEQLEAALSEHSAEFRARIRPVTLDAVQAAMPGDSVLLEFAVFHPFDPGADRNDTAFGPAHYAAYVVRKHAPPAGFDLGAAEDIDALIVKLRNALRNPLDGEVTRRARALDEAIMRPLRGSLNGATRLLVSPDGALTLVPFETLVDEHGRYLIERYATSYLTSGRDLLRMQGPRAMAGKPVILADPLFGEPGAATARAGRGREPAATGRDVLRSVTGGKDMTALYFSPLYGSAAEGRAIKSLFPDATLLTGRRATKAALERVAAPRILHIASHGFFLDDADADADAGAGRARTPPANASNPLLRSGLALAGANLPEGARGNGILTALEAAGLDLWGTRLVTLSACDTGVGEVRNGEGVYGLRRAFTLAGAETLVMSLWPVSDTIARDTMVGYYARLRTGLGRGDALRQAKLAILKRPAFAHPYYWAGFIQSGDWTSLNSAR